MRARLSKCCRLPIEGAITVEVSWSRKLPGLDGMNRAGRQVANGDGLKAVQLAYHDESIV